MIKFVVYYSGLVIFYFYFLIFFTNVQLNVAPKPLNLQYDSGIHSFFFTKDSIKM